MRKRDYIVIAHILRVKLWEVSGDPSPSIVEVQSAVIHDLANDLANYFADDNPLFKRDKFITASQGGADA